MTTGNVMVPVTARYIRSRRDGFRDRRLLSSSHDHE